MPLFFDWKHMRDRVGLFSLDWTLMDQHQSNWLLDQRAFVEVYARLAKVEF